MRRLPVLAIWNLDDYPVNPFGRTTLEHYIIDSIDLGKEVRRFF